MLTKVSNSLKLNEFCAASIPVVLMPACFLKLSYFPGVAVCAFEHSTEKNLVTQLGNSHRRSVKACYIAN